MIPMIKISALSLFLAVSTTTYAAWDELGSSEFMTVMIDKASIKKTGDKVQVRSMLDLKNRGLSPRPKRL